MDKDYALPSEIKLREHAASIKLFNFCMEQRARKAEKMTGNVPVSVAAKVYGKDAQWIRAGLISGYLPIGTATKDGKKVTDLSEQGHGSRINYYISPKLLYEQTGYLWKGEKKCIKVQ